MQFGSGADPRSAPAHQPAPPQPDATDAPVDVDVLIVGAGPTGLTAASEAVRHGLTVRIIDRKPCRSTYSKALVTHARTLEAFETMGVAESILAEGTRFAALHAHTGRRERATTVDLLSLPWGDTQYPFWLSIPQYVIEQVLEEHLGRLGGKVEWGVSLDTVHDHGDHVQAQLTGADGSVGAVRSRWLIGCDGGRSRVREQVGLRLDRTASGATFVLADVKTTAPLVEDEGNVFLRADGLLFIVPMPEPSRWRIIAHEPGASADTPITVDAAYLDDMIRRRTGLEFGSHDVTWASQFDLSHGLADRYRQGRVFLAGDAAHVHSPVGGQGLNTGVQDAHNLLWKLGLARRMAPEAAAELLDSYETERRAVARAMVAGVARMTGLLTKRSGVLRRLLGTLAPLALGRSSVQARFGRPVGMLQVAYPDSSLTVTTSSQAGHRMPNPALRTGGRLHDRLDRVRYTWVVRHRPGAALPNAADPKWHNLPLLCLPDEELTEAAGAGSDPVPRAALVRPDRHITAAGESAEALLSDLARMPSVTRYLAATSTPPGPVGDAHRSAGKENFK